MLQCMVPKHVYHSAKSFLTSLNDAKSFFVSVDGTKSFICSSAWCQIFSYLPQCMVTNHLFSSVHSANFFPHFTMPIHFLATVYGTKFFNWQSSWYRMNLYHNAWSQIFFWQKFMVSYHFLLQCIYLSIRNILIFSYALMYAWIINL